MLVVTVPAVAFKSAVITRQLCAALADVHMTLLAIRVGNLPGVGMAFGAGLRERPDAMPGGQIVRTDAVRKLFGEPAFDGGQLRLVKSEQADASQQDRHDENDNFHPGNQQLLLERFSAGMRVVRLRRTWQAQRVMMPNEFDGRPAVKNASLRNRVLGLSSARCRWPPTDPIAEKNSAVWTYHGNKMLPLKNISTPVALKPKK